MKRRKWGTVLDPAADNLGLRLADLLASRMTTGQVLAGGAVLTGPMLAITGGLVVPVVSAFGNVPGWPWVYGAALTVAGLVLLWARPRGAHLAATVAALVCAAVFGVLAGGFLALWLDWWLDEVARNAFSPPYPAVPYLMLVALYVLEADVEGRAFRLQRVARRAGRTPLEKG